jgi:hypothetical protein
MPRHYPNLKCAYTGVVMEVWHDDDVRHPGWTLRGGFDPAPGFFTREELEDCFPDMKCPYTGADIFPECRGALWFATGDFFRPRKRWQDADDLFLAVSTRGGVPPKVPRKRKPKIVVGEVVEPRSDPREGLPDALDYTKGVMAELEDRGILKL